MLNVLNIVKVYGRLFRKGIIGGHMPDYEDTINEISIMIVNALFDIVEKITHRIKLSQKKRRQNKKK